MYHPPNNAVHKLPQKPVFPSWEDGRPSREHRSYAHSRASLPMAPVGSGPPPRTGSTQSSYTPHSRFAGFDPAATRADYELRGMRDEEPYRYGKSIQSVRHRRGEWWPRESHQQHDYGSYDNRSFSESRNEIIRDKDSGSSFAPKYDHRIHNSSSTSYRQPPTRPAKSYYPSYQERERESTLQQGPVTPSYPKTLPRRSAMGDYKLQERKREASHLNHYSPPPRTGLKRQRSISSSRSRSRSRSMSRSRSRSRYYSRSRSYTRSRTRSWSRSRSMSMSRSRLRSRSRSRFSRSRSIASSRDSEAAGDQSKGVTQSPSREPPLSQSPTSEERVATPSCGEPRPVIEEKVPTPRVEPEPQSLSPKQAEPIALAPEVIPIPKPIDQSPVPLISTLKEVVPELPVAVSAEAVPGLDNISSGKPKAFDAEIEACVSPSLERSPPEATQAAAVEPTAVPDSGAVVMTPTVDQMDVKGLEGPSEVPLEPINTQSTLKMRSTVDIVTHSQLSERLSQERLRQQAVTESAQVQHDSVPVQLSPRRAWEEAFTPLPQSTPNLSRQASPKPLPARRLPPRHELIQPADNITEALRICITARRHADQETRNDRTERILAANKAIVDEPHPRSTYTTEINLVNVNAKIREALSSTNPVRQALTKSLADKNREFEQRKTALEERYYSAHKKWLLHCQRLDAAAFRQPADGITSQSTRTTRRSAAALGDAVRSDLEMEQIMISLGNDDLTDPNILATRNLAKVPDLLASSQRNPVVCFDDTSGEVFDPRKFYDITQEVEDWSEDEKKIFVKAYAQYPKQFGIISAALEHKTVEQCVLFYYVTKKEGIDFRDAIARWGGGRKKRGGGRKSGKQKAGALLADIANTRPQRQQRQAADSPANEPPPDDDMPRPRRRPKPKPKDMEIEMARAAKRAEAAAESEARRPKRNTQPLTRLLTEDGLLEKSTRVTSGLRAQPIGLAIQAPQSQGNPSNEDLLKSDGAKADYLRSLGSMAQRYERLIIQQPRQVVDALEEYATKYSVALGLAKNTICFVKSSNDPYTAGSRIIVQALPNQVPATGRTNNGSQSSAAVRPSLATTSQNKSSASSTPSIGNNLYKSPFPNPLAP